MNGKHMTPADRWTAVGVFLFFLTITVGCYMAFGGDVWITRLPTYGLSFFGFIMFLAFLDARKEACERRQSKTRKVSTFDTPWKRGDLD